MKIFSIAKMIIVGIVVLLVSGCFGGGNVELVKNGVFDDYKSMTVGKAMDNWKECDEKEWTEFESENGTNIVEFTCINTEMSNIADIKNAYSNNKDKLSSVDIISMTTSIQFTINVDDTFELSYAGSTYTWNDGKKYEANIGDKILESVYNNAYILDIEGLKEKSQVPNLVSEKDFNELMLAYTFGMLRNLAK